MSPVRSAGWWQQLHTAAGTAEPARTCHQQLNAAWRHQTACGCCAYSPLAPRAFRRGCHTADEGRAVHCTGSRSLAGFVPQPGTSQRGQGGAGRRRRGFEKPRFCPLCQGQRHSELLVTVTGDCFPASSSFPSSSSTESCSNHPVSSGAVSCVVLFTCNFLLNCYVLKRWQRIPVRHSGPIS